MSLRRVIGPICVGVTVVLLFFLGLTTYPELRRAHRFENAKAALQELPPLQRLQVLDRIAWLNGTSTMPSVEMSGMPNSDKQLRKAIDIAQARLAAARPLPPDLEELARDGNARPQWAVIQWRALLFVTAITILWGLFFLVTKITSEGRASARQGLF